MDNPSIEDRMPAWVRATDDRMVFEVMSETARRRGKVAYYRVDLLAFDGAGQCHCKDWSTRRWPAIRDGKPHGTRATLCRHGILARRFFLNNLLTMMAKQEQQRH